MSFHDSATRGAVLSDGEQRRDLLAVVFRRRQEASDGVAYEPISALRRIGIIVRREGECL